MKLPDQAPGCPGDSCGGADLSPPRSLPAADSDGRCHFVEINGRRVALDSRADRRLLAILREDLGLVAAKPGCGIGRCGACMVWLDDVPVNSCLVMAWQLDGRRVSTAELVADSPISEDIRQAIAQCGGLQCGYCSPGIVVTLTHLYQRVPRPCADEVVTLMSGHVCRCTGYSGLLRAIAGLFAQPSDVAGTSGHGGGPT